MISGWLIALLAIIGAVALVRSLYRRIAASEIEDAQRNLIGLVTNEMRERTDADDAHLGI